MPQIYKIVGNIDVEKIRNVYNTLVKRHEILRTRFFMSDSGEPVQQICNDVEPEFKYIIDEDSSEDDIISSFIRPYDLSKPSLIRLQIVKEAVNICL